MKRFYFASKSPTYCLDFEIHEELVTAQAGTPPDGRLGLREPRTERLVVLYEESKGKISRMWLRQDSETLWRESRYCTQLKRRCICLQRYLLYLL